MQVDLIIDTNVLVVANDMSEHVSKSDVGCCSKFLIDVYENKNENIIVYLDSLQQILEEYGNYCNHSGEPGIGDVFFRWLHNNQANPDVCCVQEINITNGEHSNYKEFPTIGCLNNFDLSDRKFVAVACSADKSPTIVNCSDSDWYDYRNCFSEIGIKLDFLCPDEKSNWERKEQ